MAPTEAATAPPRWKTAVSVWLALVPLLVLANFTLAPHLGPLPAALRPVAGSLVLVPLMTYVAMPIVGRLLRRWMRPVR